MARTRNGTGGRKLGSGVRGLREGEETEAPFRDLAAL